MRYARLRVLSSWDSGEVLERSSKRVAITKLGFRSRFVAAESFANCGVIPLSSFNRARRVSMLDGAANEITIGPVRKNAIGIGT
jgi:hypothetical protein